MMRNISHGNDNAPRNRQFKMIRIFAFPNKQPYKIPYVKKLLKKYNFAITLDLFPFPYKQDALITLQNYQNDSIDTITSDPPYSKYQLKKHYDDKGLAMITANRKYFTALFKEIQRTIKPGGYLITLGWNSKRVSGFEFEQIILLNHGTLHNDTIITIQKKINQSLLSFNMKNILQTKDDI